jgi:hypothetical protein
MGAMKRLSHLFQVYSMKDWGTVTLIRIWKNDPALFNPAQLTQIRSVIIPKPGETACGDGFFHKTSTDTLSFFLGDGLGHGPEAEKAVTQAGSFYEMLCKRSNGSYPVY